MHAYIHICMCVSPPLLTRGYIFFLSQSSAHILSILRARNSKRESESKSKSESESDRQIDSQTEKHTDTQTD